MGSYGAGWEVMCGYHSSCFMLAAAAADVVLLTQGAGSDTIWEPFKVTSPTQHASR